MFQMKSLKAGAFTFLLQFSMKNGMVTCHSVFPSEGARVRPEGRTDEASKVHMWTAPDLQGLALAACSDRLRSYVRPVFGSCDHRPRWASRTVKSKHESGIFCR